MSDAARNLDMATAVGEAEAAYVAANPESQRLQAEACAVMPGGNTRSVLYYPPFPLTLVRGEGARVWDADGHDYCDFLGEYTAGLYGHSHPVIRAAIEAKLADGVLMGAPGELEAKLAAELCRRFPSFEQMRLCNSGTEANLLALSAARAVSGRDAIMVFEGAYHGAVFVFGPGGSPLNAPFPFVMGRYNDAEGAEKLIDEHAGELAAVIVEPMQGAGGCIPGEPEFLQALRDATARHGIILVFDEVMTSRTGGGGLQTELGIVPDMTTLGKYVGGGLPSGAFGGRAEIMQHFDPRRPDAFMHAGTFNNHVLTMAAGLTGLTEIYDSEAAAGLDRRGQELRRRLNEAAEARGLPVQATGVGSLSTVHFQSGPIRSIEDLSSDPEARTLFQLDLLARGIYSPRRNMVNLSLPMSEVDIDGLVAVFEEFLDDRGPLLAS